MVIGWYIVSLPPQPIATTIRVVEAVGAGKDSETEEKGGETVVAGAWNRRFGPAYTRTS
jgi:hypothetical protein